MMTHFSVKNYKCLADVSLPLTPIHVIIGQNDSGKTSLLEAMLALFRSGVGDLGECFPGGSKDRELVYEGSEQSVIQLTASLDDPRDESASPIKYELWVEFREGTSTGQNAYESVNSQRIDLLKGTTQTGLKNHNRLPAHLNYLLGKVADAIGIAMLYKFDPRMMAIPAALDPARKFRLDPDGFGLSTLLDDIMGHDIDLFSAIRRDFCRFFPQFRSVRLKTEQVRNRRAMTNGTSQQEEHIGKGIYLETAKGSTIRAQQASDGAILFLGILALIHSPEPPNLLLIEEPENGIYPKRLEEIIGLLRRLQEESTSRFVPQVIMTTHSPYLLSSFQPEEVTFMRKDGETGSARACPLREAPKIADRLDGGFFLGELWYNLSEEDLFADAR